MSRRSIERVGQLRPEEVIKIRSWREKLGYHEHEEWFLSWDGTEAGYRAYWGDDVHIPTELETRAAYGLLRPEDEAELARRGKAHP